MAKSNIGVDIGATSIKAVQLKGSRGHLKIVRAAQVALPSGAVRNGEVIDPDEIANALKVLWKTGKFTTKNVTLGIGNENTLARQMNLAWETEKVFRKALPLRVGEAFPRISTNNLLLDYHPVDIQEKGSLIEQISLVVATDADKLRYLIEAFNIDNFHVQNIDFNPFALIRAAVLVGENSSQNTKKKNKKNQDENDIEVVVDVGSQITTIAIHENGQPRYVRTVPKGSELATRVLFDKLKISFEVAEILKYSLGIEGIEPARLPVSIAGRINAEQIVAGQRYLNLVAGDLVGEIRSTVEYYLGKLVERRRINKIYFSGGGAMMPGLAQRVGSELQTEIAKLNPIALFAVDSKIDKSAIDPDMGLAFGLALEAYPNG